MKYWYTFGLIFIISFLHAQTYSLQEIVSLAKNNSIKSKVARTQSLISQYQYHSFLSDLKPQILMYGTIPAYSKDYFDVRQPDGSIRFLPRSQNFSNFGFALSQQISTTGGTLSLRTDFSRFDDFNRETKAFNSTPIYLRFDQPLFAINPWKWSRKIEPLRVEEFSKKEILERQDIAHQVNNLYFEVLTSDMKLNSAVKNLESVNELLQTEQRKISLGTTSEEKILQLKHQAIRAKQQADQAKYDIQVNTLRLINAAGIPSKEVKCIIPDKIPNIKIELDTALAYAQKNRPEYVAMERTLLESQRDIDMAKASKRTVNLNASFGFNNASPNFSTLYDNTLNQQRLSIGFDIPILDWGRRNSRLQSAQAIQQLNETNNELNSQAYAQEISTLIANIELLESNIQTALETRSLAEQRYTLVYTQYTTGKNNLTELNLARQENDNALLEYISSLKSYWNTYFLLRKLTLYDFEKGVDIKE